MYAEIAPVKIVRNVAGMRALGALPNAAIPMKSNWIKFALYDGSC